MLKKLIRISFVFLLFIGLMFNKHIVQAHEISGKSDLTKFKIFNEYKQVHPDAKCISKKSTYLKISHDKSLNKNFIEEFTEREYLNDIKRNKVKHSCRNSAIATDEDNFGWIKLNLQVYNDDNDSYSTFGFFEWMKKPVFRLNEIVSLSHGSGVVFDYTKSKFELHQGGSHSYSKYKDKNYKSDIGGIAFTYDDEYTAMPEGNPYGLIKVVSKCTTRYGEIKFTYAHGEYGLECTPSISIPLDSGLTIGAKKHFSKENVTVMVDFTKW